MAKNYIEAMILWRVHLRSACQERAVFGAADAKRQIGRHRIIADGGMTQKFYRVFLVDGKAKP